MNSEEKSVIQYWTIKIQLGLVYVARLWFLFYSALYYTFIGPLRYPRIIRRQATSSMMVETGVNSLPILLLINFLVGIILAMQVGYQLDKFDAEGLVPGLVAITVCREIGPLITAVIISARVGAAIAAEL